MAPEGRKSNDLKVTLVVVQVRKCFRMDLTYRLMFPMRTVEDLKASLVVVQVRKWLKVGFTG